MSDKKRKNLLVLEADAVSLIEQRRLHPFASRENFPAELEEKKTPPPHGQRRHQRRTSILKDYYKRGFLFSSHESIRVSERRYKIAKYLQTLRQKSHFNQKLCASYNPVRSGNKKYQSHGKENLLLEHIGSREHRLLDLLFANIPESIREPLENFIFEGIPPGKTGLDRVRVGLDIISDTMKTLQQRQKGKDFSDSVSFCHRNQSQYHKF